MASHSSNLAQKIPRMEEPGGLQSMGSLGVGRDWVTSLSLFTFMQWRRKWQPTPVFLPGESQGRQSLVGCCLWGHTESDTTEATQQQHFKNIKAGWMDTFQLLNHHLLKNLSLPQLYKVPFSSVQSLSHVRLFATPRIAARWASCPSPTPGVHPDSRPSSQ